MDHCQTKSEALYFSPLCYEKYSCPVSYPVGMPYVMVFHRTEKDEKNPLKRCASRGLSIYWDVFELRVGGEGGIRTHVPAHHRQDDFESSPLRPLRYLSAVNQFVLNKALGWFAHLK